MTRTSALVLVGLLAAVGHAAPTGVTPQALDGSGQTLAQDWDALLGTSGAAGTDYGTAGWSTNNNGENGGANVVVTDDFPLGGSMAVGSFNAGALGSSFVATTDPVNFPGQDHFKDLNADGGVDVGDQDGAADRCLANGNTSLVQPNEMNFWMTVTGASVKAYRLAFTIEAWGADPALAANPGEAAFDAEVYDDGVRIVDHGKQTTGLTLPVPHTDPAGGPLSAVINGNLASNQEAFDSGVLELQGVNVAVGSELRVRLNAQAQGQMKYWMYGADDFLFRALIDGDTDGDGDVDDTDIQNIVDAAKFGAGPSGTTWAEGDFDQDDDVDAYDIQLILAGGAFPVTSYGPAPAADGPTPADLLAAWGAGGAASTAPEPAALALMGAGLAGLAAFRRR